MLAQLLQGQDLVSYVSARINAGSLLDHNNELTGSHLHTLTRGNRRRIIYREKEAKEHTAVLLHYFAWTQHLHALSWLESEDLHLHS